MSMSNGDILRSIVENEKQKEYANKSIRTLGEVILLLQSQPQDNIIKIDFTDEQPCEVYSYRGYYEDLSIDYNPGQPIAVKVLLKMLEESIGKTYFGYHGGEYIMNRKTLVWVAKYSHTGRMLVDIKTSGNTTSIITMEDDY